MKKAKYRIRLLINDENWKYKLFHSSYFRKNIQNDLFNTHMKPKTGSYDIRLQKRTFLFLGPIFLSSAVISEV